MSEVPTASAESLSIECDLSDPGGSLYTDFDSNCTPVQLTQTKPGIAEGQTRSQQLNINKRPNRKDWIDTDNPLHCKPCDFTAKDVQEFQDHSLSYKHIKKTAEVLEMKVNTKKDEEKKQPVSFVCEVCSCSCNSESAWNSHLLGAKHRKNLEKQGAERQFQKQKMKYSGGIGTSAPGPLFNYQPSHRNKPYQKSHLLGSSPTPCANDFMQYKEPLIGLEYVTEIQVSGQNPRYHCKLCDAKFDHNVKFPHLVGAKHRFNVLKEKNPAIAQEIRVGVKKRSELTGKLLEEAMKIEQEEGRQQVKTCVEASPFEKTASLPSLMGKGPRHDQRINPMGKVAQKPSGLKRNPNINIPSLFMQPSFQSDNNFQGPGRSRGRGQQQQGRGCGGFVPRVRGRGRGNNSGRGYHNNRSFTGGYNHQNNQSSFSGSFNQQNVQSFTGGYSPQDFHPSLTNAYNLQNTQPSFTGGYSGSYQHNTQPRFVEDSHQQCQSPDLSTEEPLLPQEAFHPRSPSRNNFGPNLKSSAYGQGSQNYSSQALGNTWNHPMQEQNMTSLSATAQAAKAESSATEYSSEPAKPNLLQNLSDLGKLVNSEEDASIALQVSNALTQALLKYRMQNLE